MDSSPVGWLCVVPPLLTIVLAIISKRVVMSLLLGIIAAILILMPSHTAYQAARGDAFLWEDFVVETVTGLGQQLFESHLWPSLIDTDHMRVFLFTALLGMQVAMIHRMGGMLGIVQWAAPLARSRRGGQLLTWFLGLIIFIDDYANTLLLGSTMRPVTDRLRISREKLAYLVDSTAAPVSGLALVSTWVATEIGNMKEGYEEAGIDIGSQTFGIFLQTIPSRFYILFCLAFVFLGALLCRDFGPMLRAEQRARKEPKPDAPKSSADAADQPRGAAINAILPIVITIVVVVWLLAVTGMQAESVVTAPAFDDFRAWGQIIGQGDSYVALVYGGLAGLAVALVLNGIQRRLAPGEVRRALLEGFGHVMPALIILWLAWTLSNLTGDEYLTTGRFLADQISSTQFPAAFMPTIVFVLSAGIAFATGTSWGTMAIVMPMSIPLVYQLVQNDLGIAQPAPDHYLLVASIGSVLAGAIFGDHCSPISDTTILSSRSSDCDHIAHVRTQMPYALVVGLVSIFCGTLPAGFGVNSWLLLALGMVVLVLVLLIAGRRVTDD